MVSPFHWVTIPNIALKRAVCVNCSFAIKGAQDMWMHMHRFMHVTWTLLNFGLAQQSWIAHDHSDSDQSNLLSLQSSELLLCFRDMFSKQGFVHECAMLLKTSIESPWMISLPVWLQCWAPKLRSSSDVCWSGLHRWDAIPRRQGSDWSTNDQFLGSCLYGSLVASIIYLW